MAAYIISAYGGLALSGIGASAMDSFWRGVCYDREGKMQDIVEATTLHDALQQLRDVNDKWGNVVKIVLHWREHGHATRPDKAPKAASKGNTLAGVASLISQNAARAKPTDEEPT